MTNFFFGEGVNFSFGCWDADGAVVLVGVANGTAPRAGDEGGKSGLSGVVSGFMFRNISTAQDTTFLFADDGLTGRTG